jgi:signal transduction histidine kinase
MVEEARQMSGSLDDIIWNISARNDSLASMIARMRRYASEVFEAKRILHSLSMPEDLEELTLSMEQRRDLYLIFKESVNNIVKHSHCSRASVTVTVIQKDLVLQIQDDGVGYDPATHTNRNGLVNLRERARNLKGRLDIESGPGKGTSIKLVFPLRAHHPKGLLKQ